MRLSHTSAAFAVALLSSLALAGRAHAQVTPTFHVEGSADVMLTETYRDRFDWGGRYAVRAGLEVLGPLAVQVGFQNAWFPVEGQDPGGLYAFEIGARGFFRIDDSAIGGPFVDANVGLGLTGDLARFVFDIGVGWELFPADILGIGPVIRYGQIVQPDGEAVGDDAYLLSVGLIVTVRLELGGESTASPTPISIEPAAPSDGDGDGVDDTSDRCPEEAEDRDRFQDDDGCVDPDNDADGIADEQDECPDAAETRNDFQDEDGCPDEAPTVVVRDRDQGELLPQEVQFRLGSDRVSPRFHGELEAVCALLAERPDARIRVIGHADEQGAAAANHRLGAERAGAVAEQLVICGVDPTRIESRSYGDTRLACSDETDECHARNRRVELRLLPPE
jgi:OOP family OmpA-OmpF porin